MSKKIRGEAICETVSELKFRERLRQLDEERQRKERHKKSRFPEHEGLPENEQKKKSINNDSTDAGICQDTTPQSPKGDSSPYTGEPDRRDKA